VDSEQVDSIAQLGGGASTVTRLYDQPDKGKAEVGGSSRA